MANKIKFNDVRFLYLTMCIFIFIGANITIPMPISIAPWTQQFYNVVQSLPDNALVYIVASQGSSDVADMSEAVLVCFQHLAAKNARVIIWDTGDASTPYTTKFLQVAYGTPINQNPKYGTNLIYLGYIPGAVVVFETHKRNIWGLSTVDNFGNALSKYPLSQNVISVKDVNLIIGLNARGLDSAFVVPLGSTCIEIGPGTAMSFLGYYYAAGFFKGMVYGQRGGAEYEILSGYHAKGMSYMFNITLTTVFIISILIVINIIYITKKIRSPSSIIKKEVP